MGLIGRISRFPKFLSEVKSELKKVNWSTREELTSATILVIIGASILTFYIFLVDSSFSRLIALFLK